MLLGIGGVPMAGDTLTVVESEARAREVAAEIVAELTGPGSAGTGA